MRLSENRKLATVVLVICILASIVLFGGGGLRNERYDIMQVFSDGTDTSLSVRHSMEAYLQRCAERASALAEQGVKLGADSALIEDVRAAAEATGQGGEDLDGRHEAYQQLLPAVEALYTALQQSNSADELLDARLAYNDFKGAVNLIQNDQYPVMASAFNRKLEAFPANLIGGLFGVKPLNTFGW